MAKFKTGDQVRAVIGWHEQIIVGNIYTIARVEGGFVTIEKNELGHTGGYADSRFELATPAPAADECAACGEPACDAPRFPDIKVSASIHGEPRRLCAAHWELPCDQTRVAIYERHIKPKELAAEQGCRRCGSPQHQASTCPRDRVAADQPKADPYNPDGLKPEVRLEFEKARRVAMDDKDTRSGRRAALVQQLKSEMGRAFTPAHPVEGRSERVYGGRRWGEK
jgi:hypothetical protein